MVWGRSRVSAAVRLAEMARSVWYPVSNWLTTVSGDSSIAPLSALGAAARSRVTVLGVVKR
jgi:hypothetical protein